MRNNDDAQDIRRDAVVEHEGEAAEGKPVQRGIDSHADFRMIEEERRHASNFGHEARTQPRYPGLIIFGLLTEFPFRFRMELQFQRLRRRSRLAKTCSPGTGCTLPSS